jgi:hypothetical protein
MEHTLRSPGLHSLNHKDISDLIYQEVLRKSLGSMVGRQNTQVLFVFPLGHPQFVSLQDGKMAVTASASHSQESTPNRMKKVGAKIERMKAFSSGFSLVPERLPSHWSSS